MKSNSGMLDTFEDQVSRKYIAGVFFVFFYRSNFNTWNIERSAVLFEKDLQSIDGKNEMHFTFTLRIFIHWCITQALNNLESVNMKPPLESIGDRRSLACACEERESER